MLIDFDDRFTDIEPVGSAINRRDGVFLAILAHVAVVAVFLLAPPLNLLPKRAAEPIPLQAEAERPQFVFVQPRVDLEAAAPRKRADNSDRDRVSRSPERPQAPANPLPYSRGNSAERVEAAPDTKAAGNGPAPDPAPETPPTERTEPLPEPTREAQAMARPTAPMAPPKGGELGEALRNLQKYVEQESFNNPKGNVQDLGPLQFDTKGVEFGPWIRRFIAQVRRNWFVPYAAMTMRGRVVLQFNVHKDGRITDLSVVKPSEIGSFNNAAFNALAGSNPTEPLPAEYPDDKAFFTVTFYYNESPESTPRQ